LGRDLWTRLWDGARVSLIIAFAAVVINFIVGAIYGGISGYCGGLVDNIMMRIVDLINGIPYMIIVMLLMMVFEPGMVTIIIAYSTVGWTGMARLVRGQVVQLKEQEFVMASKVMGGSPLRIIARHLIPNTLSVMVVNLTLSIPNAIFTEAFLSYIGLGVRAPQPSWGILASDGAAVMTVHPYVMIIPAIFISLTMLSFNLVGDALRDAFDPKQRK
jgi:oligopeptide transport system permease protein